jgi:hypothetical protein
MSEWDVPGYDVLGLLGYGTAGELWRARDRSSGALVALRRLAGGDRPAVASVRAQATVVRSLPTTHLVRLRTTTRAGRDDVLVLDHAAGGSLSALLQRRGPLAPGEVVTALAPVAEALGQAHAHGLVHGRVDAAGVLLTGDGKPLLDGLGMAALHDAEDGLDPTGALGPAADVWALGALAHQLLTGRPPGTTPLAVLAPRAPLPLVQAVEAALGFDPTTRPGAADLAAALLAACPATPLQGVVAAALPEPHRRRLPHLRVLVVAGAAVAGVVLAGWAWGTHAVERPARVATTRAATPPAGTDWRAVVAALDGSRAEAFRQADPTLLLRVYAPASPLLSTDQLAVAALQRARRTAEGVEHQVDRVTAVQTGADRAELAVVEVLGAYALRDAAGRVVERHPAGPATTHLIELVRTPTGWRVLHVQQA